MYKIFHARVFLLLIFISIFSLYTTKEVFASDFSLKCDEKKCTPSSIAQFFDKPVLWYPSYSVTNTVTIENKSESIQYIWHKATNLQLSKGIDLAKGLELTIVRKSVNKEVWRSSLADFYTTNESVLGVLGSNKEDSFEYTITMRDVGNEYQGASTQFGLIFGFFIPAATPTPTPTPTTTTTPKPTTSPNPTGEAQGGVAVSIAPTIIAPTVTIYPSINPPKKNYLKEVVKQYSNMPEIIVNRSQRNVHFPEKKLGIALLASAFIVGCVLFLRRNKM